MSTTTSSLEAPVGEEGESQVSDLIENKASVSPDESIEHMLDKERVKNQDNWAICA